MTLHLPDHWVWDFWFAVDGADDGDVHVFYLYAPRSLGDPELRHRHARIGHAVSRDLDTWTVLPDPLPPAAPGSFDDLATWTGSVVWSGGRWCLYYTGVSTVDSRQRIGMAVSDDLLTWSRRPMAFESDPRWYEPEDWRDPWVYRAADGWHMLTCARANRGAVDGRGVIGHATSPDGLRWTARSPVSEPGEYAQLEVPQRVRIGGRWRIVFSAGARDHSAARLARPGVVAEGGTHYLDAADDGSYRTTSDRFLLGDPEGRYYAGRFLWHGGRWHFLAWQQYDERGGFVGALTGPMPVRIVPGGRLDIDRPDDLRPLPEQEKTQWNIGTSAAAGCASAPSPTATG